MLAKPRFYLDNAATTGIDPNVVDYMVQLYQQQLANPSSLHTAGRQARGLLEGAKEQILALVGAPCGGREVSQVFVTSGGTEANNLAVLGLASTRPGMIIVSSIEHPSVMEPALTLKKHGRDVRILPVDQSGQCRLDVLKSWLDEAHGQLPSRHASWASAVSLVSVILGNNEIGVIQDLKAICDICHRYDVPVHTDGVQAVGKMSFSMRQLGVDALTITAHKFHGPVGVGALVVRGDLNLAPMIFGGGQQFGVRPGTEPTVLVAALVKALEVSIKAFDERLYDDVQRCRDRFEQLILSHFTCASVVCSSVPRLPHISSLAFDGMDRQALLMALDLAGIQCSSGSACSSGSSRPSPILAALGLADSLANGVLRFSFSRTTTIDEVELAAQNIAEVVSKMQKRSTFDN